LPPRRRRSGSFYVGALLYTHLMQQAGAVTAVAVTTVRKSLTVVLSFALFPKPYTHKYTMGGLCLVAAIMLDARAHMARGGPPRTAGQRRADGAGARRAKGAHQSDSELDSEAEEAPLNAPHGAKT
jgi:hypothetical protein